MYMSQTKKIALVIESGSIDKLYCAFIMASTSVAMGWEAHLYFTFWGLQSLVKGAMEKASLEITNILKKRCAKTLKG